MKSFPALLALLVSLLAPLTGRAEKSPTDYVNPLIDTHKSRWFFFSSACRPFGMVNLSLPIINVEEAEKYGLRRVTFTAACLNQHQKLSKNNPITSPYVQ